MKRSRGEHGDTVLHTLAVIRGNGKDVSAVARRVLELEESLAATPNFRGELPHMLFETSGCPELQVIYQ